MSSAFQNFTGFNIHQDGENIGARKSKREELQGKPPATKRAALGTITNTNTTRVQPRRAAKQPTEPGLCLQENVFKQGKDFQPTNPFDLQSSQAFSIHVDEPETLSTITEGSSVHLETSSLLRPALTSLPTHSESIADHSLSVEDSPMLLDESSMKASCEDDVSEEDGFQKVLTVPEYSNDIYSYLREAELRNRPKPGYMRKQQDITMNMRSILVDWLVEVAEEYKLHRETLCLSVNYIDRFLSQMSVVRGKLQLVGAASMFLAAKYEEIYPPEVGEFVYITDDTYTKKQVLRMEHLVLKVLSFDVAIPTFNCFCEKFLKDMNADDKTSSLAMYLAELTMIDSEPFLNYLPSVIAAASICLSNITLQQETWPQVLAEKTGYSLSELSECIQHLHTSFSKAAASPQQAVREKYKQEKYQQVSLLTPPSLLSMSPAAM